MRVLLVNWAPIWDGATRGGGVNGYCQALALALARRGHDVCYLFGGVTYVPGAGGVEPGPCAVRRHDDWLGIRVFEVVNSPVLAPSLPQFREPVAETASPELEDRLTAFARLLRPDVIHFHNIEGFSAGCADALRVGATGDAAHPRRVGVVFSLHNYHTVCPQVYFLQGHRRLCESFDNGHACVGCIESPDPSEERAARARAYAAACAGLTVSAAPARPGPGERPAPDLRARAPRFPLLRALAAEARAAVFRRGAGSAGDAAEPAHTPAPVDLPGAPVESLTGVSSPRPAPADDDRGRTRSVVAELKPRQHWSPDDPECRPLDNTIRPEPPSDRAPNEYARRRAAMVAMLNRCDRVLAVSEFVRRKFEALGVDPGVIETMPIGTRANEVVRRHRELLFDPPRWSEDPRRLIRVAFMGYNNWYKGLSMFCDSLELLPPASLARLHLFVYALDGHTIEWRFRRMEPRLGRLLLHHGYEFHDLPWMLGGKDLGVVPSVWWDNAPQTVFEFQACGVPLLAADVGGIPDFVHEGVNGLLFRANDRHDLARRLQEVIDNPAMLESLRRNVRPPKEMDDHAAELEALYDRCVRSTAAPVGA